MVVGGHSETKLTNEEGKKILDEINIMKREAASEKKGKLSQSRKHQAKKLKKSNKGQNKLNENAKKKRKPQLKKESKRKRKMNKTKINLNNRQERTKIYKSFKTKGKRTSKGKKGKKKSNSKKKSRSRKLINLKYKTNQVNTKNIQQNKKAKTRENATGKQRYRKKNKRKIQREDCESNLTSYSIQYEGKARNMERQLARIENRQKFLKNKNKKKEEFNRNYRILLSALGVDQSVSECFRGKHSKFSSKIFMFCLQYQMF